MPPHLCYHERVNLEIVCDITFESFLLAFPSRKSLPRKMISDNASTYLTAAEQIRHQLALKEELGQRGVSWDFPAMLHGTGDSGNV